MNQLILDSERVEELQQQGWVVTKDEPVLTYTDSIIHKVQVKKDDREFGSIANTRTIALDGLRTTIAQHENESLDLSWLPFPAEVIDVQTKAAEAADLTCGVGDQLRRLREKEGVSQRQLADKVGFGKSLIGWFEFGARNLPLTKLVKIAQALGYEVEIRFKKKQR